LTNNYTTSPAATTNISSFDDRASRLSGFNDIKEDDLIEAFSTEKLADDLGALTSARA
jgi:hypothetical protein